MLTLWALERRWLGCWVSLMKGLVRMLVAITVAQVRRLDLRSPDQADRPRWHREQRRRHEGRLPWLSKLDKRQHRNHR
jgi:hypothetical protein